MPLLPERKRFQEGKLNPDERVETRSTQFPIEFAERLAAASASFNMSTKAVTILLLDTSFTGAKTLAARFKEAYAGSRISKFHEMVVENYCRYTLGPIGFVADELVVNDASGRAVNVGYGLSAAGETYGKAIAAGVLDFEYRNGFSLYPILGKTSTPSKELKRAPALRADILVALADDSGLYIAELARKLGTPSTTINDTLLELERAGIVTKEKSSYTLNDPDKLHAVVTQSLRRAQNNYRFIFASAIEALHEMGEEITTVNMYSLLESKQQDTGEYVYPYTASNRTAQQENNIANLYEILASADTPLTNNQLVEQLDIPSATIYHYLQGLLAAGKIQSLKLPDRNEFFYTITPPEDSEKE